MPGFVVQKNLFSAGLWSHFITFSMLFFYICSISGELTFAMWKLLLQVTKIMPWDESCHRHP